MRRRYLATTRLPSGATLMLERELKLYVPEASRIGLKKALTQLGATELALNARYFDTENRDLAKAGIALRLRQEGDQWVQTVKERSEEHRVGKECVSTGRSRWAAED